MLNWLRRLSIRVRIYSLAAMAALLLALLAATGYTGVRHAETGLQAVYLQHIKPAQRLAHMVATLKEVRFRMAGYLSGALPAVGSRNQVITAQKSIPADWHAFTKAIKGSSRSVKEQRIVADVTTHFHVLTDLLGSLNTAYANDNKSRVSTLLQEGWVPVELHITNQLAKLVPLENSAVHTEYLHLKAREDHAATLMWSAAAIALFLLLAVSLHLGISIDREAQTIRAALKQAADGDLTVSVDLQGRDELAQMGDSLNQMVERLASTVAATKRAASNVTDGAREIQGLATHTANNATSQVDQLLQVNTAMDEMSSTIGEVAKNSEAAANEAESASTVVGEGEGIVNQTADALSSIDQAVKDSSEAVGRLGTATDKIGEITNVIKAIAEQTNLLALNAAIEAARAGENGRGFAVVADEVRQLSQRTTRSIEDIEATIHDVSQQSDMVVAIMQRVTEQVAHGVSLGQSSSAALKRIHDAVDTVRNMLTQIATATEEQSATTEEIVRNVSGVYALSEQSQTHMQGTTDALASLTQTAEALEASVEVFRIPAA